MENPVEDMAEPIVSIVSVVSAVSAVSAVSVVGVVGAVGAVSAAQEMGWRKCPKQVQKLWFLQAVSKSILTLR